MLLLHSVGLLRPRFRSCAHGLQQMSQSVTRCWSKEAEGGEEGKRTNIVQSV
jgi:hypothetical protein